MKKENASQMRKVMYINNFSNLLPIQQTFSAKHDSNPSIYSEAPLEAIFVEFLCLL